MGADSLTGTRNLCEVAVHLLQTMPVNSATTYAVRTVLRGAVNRSNPLHKGNMNRRNCRYISSSANEQLLDVGKGLVADHAIPISLLIKDVYARPAIKVDELVEMVSRYSVMVLITKNEDESLSSHGLKMLMPSSWDGHDVLARYKHVGINVLSNPSYQMTPAIPEDDKD